MDFFHTTVHSWRKKQNQQVESCLGHLICNGPSNPSFNRPLFSSGCVIYIYILYIYRCTVNWSVPGSAEQTSRCSFWCVSSNTTPGADQSCCLRGSGWGTALAKPLAFPKRLLYLNCFFYFFCTLPCLRTAAVCGNSPSTRHIKSGHAHWKKG